MAAGKEESKRVNEHRTVGLSTNGDCLRGAHFMKKAVCLSNNCLLISLIAPGALTPQDFQPAPHVGKSCS